MQYQPGGFPSGGRPPLTPGDVRSVVFTTTRMRLGYDVEEVDAFLDQVQRSLEQLHADLQAANQRLVNAESLRESQAFQARAALEQALARLGGPTGAAGGPVIDLDPARFALWPPPAGPRFELPPPAGLALPPARPASAGMLPQPTGNPFLAPAPALVQGPAGAWQGGSASLPPPSGMPDTSLAPPTEGGGQSETPAIRPMPGLPEPEPEPEVPAAPQQRPSRRAEGAYPGLNMPLPDGTIPPLASPLVALSQHPDSLLAQQTDAAESAPGDAMRQQGEPQPPPQNLFDDAPELTKAPPSPYGDSADGEPTGPR